MKTILEEQEVAASARPVSQERQAATKVATAQAQPNPRVIDTPAEDERRPSCCDLAAEFLCRG